MHGFMANALLANWIWSSWSVLALRREGLSGTGPFSGTNFRRALFRWPFCFGGGSSAGASPLEVGKRESASRDDDDDAVAEVASVSSVWASHKL